MGTEATEQSNAPLSEVQTALTQQESSPLIQLLRGGAVPRRLAIRGALEGGAAVVALTDIALLAACGPSNKINLRKIETKDPVELALLTNYNFFLTQESVTQTQDDKYQLAAILATSVPTTDEENTTHSVRKRLMETYSSLKESNGLKIDPQQDLSDPQLAMIANTAVHRPQTLAQTILDIKSMYGKIAEIDPSQTSFSDHVTLAMNCVSLKDSLKFDDNQMAAFLTLLSSAKGTLHDAESNQTAPLLVADELAQQQGRTDTIKYLSSLADTIQSLRSDDRMPTTNLDGNISFLVLAALLTNGDTEKIQSMYDTVQQPVTADSETNPVPYTVNSILTLAAAAVAKQFDAQVVLNTFNNIDSQVNDSIISAQLVAAWAFQKANLPDFLKEAASIGFLSNLLNAIAIALTP